MQGRCRGDIADEPSSLKRDCTKDLHGSPPAANLAICLVRGRGRSGARGDGLILALTLALP